MGSACFNTGSTNYFIADDFTIPADQTWNISAIDFFAYQTSYTGTSSPISIVRVNIFNGDPSTSNATSVFGNDIDNRFASSEDSKIYRIGNSIIPSIVVPYTNRKIWKVKANVSKTLSAGTYWIKYQFENVVTANGGFCPTVTIVGARSLPTFNSKQLASTSTWINIMDEGDPTSSPDVPVDFPFIITYTSSTLGANEVLQYDNRIQIYPNPTSDFFKINIPTDISVKNIEIIDVSGRIVKTFNKAEHYKINDLQKGVYTIKINTTDVPKTTRLIIK